MAATFIVVALIAVILGSRGGRNTTPAGEPGTSNAGGATSEEVALGFVQAFGDHDAKRAIAYLAQDVDLSGLDAATVDGLPLQLSLFEAMGYEQMRTSCDEVGVGASGAAVHCTFDFHAIRSDEIGLGPYSGSSFDLVVRDGTIVNVSLYLEIEEFSPQMWEPFALWVSREHPRDGAVMFNDDYTNFRLTEGSIRLWERRTREYVQEVGR